MRSAIPLAALAVLIALTGPKTASAAGSCTRDARQINAEVARVTTEVNEQGFDAFRRVPLSEPGTAAVSPFLQWYALHGKGSAKMGDRCTARRMGIAAFLSAIKGADGRHFHVTAVADRESSVEFRDEAPFDVQFTTYRPHDTLPFYADHRGITAVRLDSTKGKLSLYLFSASPSLEPTIENFRSQLTATTWRKMIAQFKPEQVSILPYPLSLKGSSLVPSLVGSADVEFSLQTSAREILAYGSIKFGQETSKPRAVAKMEPLMLLLCVLVDTNTGAIIEIGANTKERDAQ